MVDTSQRWNLFGLDLRDAYQYWHAAWQELFSGERSWLRRSLEETVRVSLPEIGTEHYYRAGKQVQKQKSKTHACIIPDQLVLLKELNLPANVELELESLLALEVRARSPFLEEYTSYGWRIAGYKGGQIQVCLVMLSRATVLSYLRKNNLAESGQDIEVWASVDNKPIVINGFGELSRYQRHQQRVKWLIAGTIYSLVMLALLISIPVAVKYHQLEIRDKQYVAVQQSSAKAVDLRMDLATNNERAREINQLLANSSDPYPIIERLSELLSDKIWLNSVDIRGDKVLIDGFASNAAALMQKLSEQSEIEKVRAPSAIRFDSRSRKEHFVLELTMKQNKGDRL